MEKDEIKNNIKTQFEKIVELENKKKILVDVAKTGILQILKESMPEIVAIDRDIKFRVDEINFAALEIKESYSCDSGRVIYFPPWLEDPEGVIIQGIQEKTEPFLFGDDNSVIEGIVGAFINKISTEGGEDD